MIVKIRHVVDREIVIENEIVTVNETEIEPVDVERVIIEMRMKCTETTVMDNRIHSETMIITEEEGEPSEIYRKYEKSSKINRCLRLCLDEKARNSFCVSSTCSLSCIEAKDDICSLRLVYYLSVRFFFLKHKVSVKIFPSFFSKKKQNTKYNINQHC